MTAPTEWTSLGGGAPGPPGPPGPAGPAGPPGPPGPGGGAAVTVLDFTAMASQDLTLPGDYLLAAGVVGRRMNVAPAGVTLVLTAGVGLVHTGRNGVGTSTTPILFDPTTVLSASPTGEPFTRLGMRLDYELQNQFTERVEVVGLVYYDTDWPANPAPGTPWDTNQRFSAFSSRQTNNVFRGYTYWAGGLALSHDERSITPGVDNRQSVSLTWDGSSLSGTAWGNTVQDTSTNRLIAAPSVVRAAFENPMVGNRVYEPYPPGGNNPFGGGAGVRRPVFALLPYDLTPGYNPAFGPNQATYTKLTLWGLP